MGLNYAVVGDYKVLLECVLVNISMVIDKKFLDDLSALAKASPRLRQSYDLRNTPEDNSQRMLNALEPGTVMYCNEIFNPNKPDTYFEKV